MTHQFKNANKKIFTIKDRALDIYNMPFTLTTAAQAVRSFADEVNSANSALAKHPDDYDLYIIGEYDETTAQLIPVDIELIVRGKDVVRPQGE